MDVREFGDLMVEVMFEQIDAAKDERARYRILWAVSAFENGIECEYTRQVRSDLEALGLDEMELRTYLKGRFKVMSLKALRAVERDPGLGREVARATDEMFSDWESSGVSGSEVAASRSSLQVWLDARRKPVQ